jgi:hypothetical protein
MKRIIIAAALAVPAIAFAGQLPEHSESATASSTPAASDLVGRVTNSNGVRDDVNDYILAAFADDPKKRTAAVRFARANQHILEVVAESRPVTQELVTKISYAGLCFAQSLDRKSFLKQAREITARTFNTEARFRAHDDFSKQAFGMSVATSDDLDACEASK